MRFFRLLLASGIAGASLPAMAANGPSNAIVPAGYSMTAVATGLNFPTALTFMGNAIWVTEAGLSASTPPTVKKIDNKGNVTTMLTSSMLPTGTMVGPLTGITFAQGWMWIVHRQMASGGVPVGAISKFKPENPAGTFQTVVSGLPFFGDHPGSSVAVGGDGRIYVSTGLPTNAGVVGPDNGWATSFPTFHDFPPVDIELSGIAYKTPIPFPPLDPTASLMTEPFMAFGSGTVAAGTVVHGVSTQDPGNGIITAGGGSVYSFDPSASDAMASLRLEAWGFRNDYGIRFDPQNPNELFVSNNGTDVRTKVINGQDVVDTGRPVDNDWDDLFVFHIGQTANGQAAPFFGWPDFFHDPVSHKPLAVTDAMFCPSGGPCPQFAFSDAFRKNLTTQPAFAELDLHSSANMFDFSPPSFGFKDDIFIAETGSLPPGTGAGTLVGYKIVRVNRISGEPADFITHTSSDQNTIFEPTGFNKPIDVKFRGPDMFIADFGVFVPARPTPGSGKIWMVAPSH